MLRFIGKRLLILIPTLLAITIVVQLFIIITPGDPARMMGGTQASEEELEALREEMGLNDPFLVRYWNYMKSIFKGDFGISYRTKAPVMREIMKRFPYTLLLVFVSMALALLMGIPTGIYAATHQYTWKDNLSIFLSLFCVSMPAFWFALLLIKYLCVKWRLLPVAGVDTWKGWILPCMSQSLGLLALMARQMRGDMLEVQRQDFITTARAKGLPERSVIFRHALKNASIPSIMVIGGVIGTLLGGSLIIAMIYSIPGLGQYVMTGLNNRDYPVIQSGILIISTMFAIVILIVDVIFALVDPRIRLQYTRKKIRKEETQNEETEEKIETV